MVLYTFYQVLPYLTQNVTSIVIVSIHKYDSVVLILENDIRYIDMGVKYRYVHVYTYPT